jgi:hypothetical protein
VRGASHRRRGLAASAARQGQQLGGLEVDHPFVLDCSDDIVSDERWPAGRSLPVRPRLARPLLSSPILKQLTLNRTQDTLELTNGIPIEVRPVSFRKLRGPTYIAVIADELAFWYSPDATGNAITRDPIAVAVPLNY